MAFAAERECAPVPLCAPSEQFLPSGRTRIYGRMDQNILSATSPAESQATTPLTVRVKEACRLTGIGRSKLYELIAADEIETIKVGTITLIPLASLKHFLELRGLAV